MKEKFRPAEYPPKTEPKEGEGILFFEGLDKESQKFVLEVKQLSEMSDQEFLKKLPGDLRRQVKDSLEDESVYAATMWELVTFYLSELKDSQELGTEMYSQRTEHLAKTMLERMVRLRISELLPLEFKIGYLKEKFPEFLRSGILPEDPKWQVRLMDHIINAYHTSIRMPGLLGLVDDLYRYVFKDFKNLSNEERRAREDEFFQKLGNLRTRP